MHLVWRMRSKTTKNRYSSNFFGHVVGTCDLVGCRHRASQCNIIYTTCIWMKRKTTVLILHWIYHCAISFVIYTIWVCFFFLSSFTKTSLLVLVCVLLSVVTQFIHRFGPRCDQSKFNFYTNTHATKRTNYQTNYFSPENI